MRVGLARVEWYAVGFAVLVAHGFLVHEWFYPSSYDAGLYAQIGREIAQHGLFQRYTASEIRIYGYPFFLSVLYRGTTVLGLSFEIVLFEVQLLLYLCASFFFRAALTRVSAAAGRIALCGLLVNYYVLIYTPESLTESLSLTLLVFAGGCWLETYRRATSPWPLVAGSLAVGFAMMVRPGNVFMVVAWIIGVIVIGIRKRPGIVHLVLSGMYLVAAVTLPALPQLANNILHFGKRTPLLVEDLGHMQQVWGIQNIKYATAMPPIPRGAVYYVSPLWGGTTIDEKSPWRWYVANPGRGFLTLAIHTFNLTDQDLLFTYSRDLDPWYRLPLGVVNHGAVALGLIGLVLVGRRVRAQGEPEQIDAYAVLLILMAANLAIYSWTAVEMRFGSVLLLMLFPLAGYAALRIVGARDVRTIAAAGLGLAMYVVLALTLSAWVRDQAELIRDARVARHSRAEPVTDIAPVLFVEGGQQPRVRDVPGLQRRAWDGFHPTEARLGRVGVAPRQRLVLTRGPRQT
jgi:hypothetical protein